MQGFENPEPFAVASGLGIVRAIALGRLWAASGGRQLVIASVEGALHVFDVSALVAESSAADKGENRLIMHLLEVSSPLPT